MHLSARLSPTQKAQCHIKMPPTLYVSEQKRRPTPREQTPLEPDPPTRGRRRPTRPQRRRTCHERPQGTAAVLHLEINDSLRDAPRFREEKHPPWKIRCRREGGDQRQPNEPPSHPQQRHGPDFTSGQTAGGERNLGSGDKPTLPPGGRETPPRRPKAPPGRRSWPSRQGWTSPHGRRISLRQKRESLLQNGETGLECGSQDQDNVEVKDRLYTQTI